MDVKTFISNFREAFGGKPESPIGFWYSQEPVGELQKINGCYFKGFNRLREGKTLTLDVETIGCGGGKFYSGFTDMPDRIPNFVSHKEKYKKTPEQVLDFIDRMDLERASLPYLNFDYIDRLTDFDGLEGILFFATPDVLSGLTTWAYFDNDEEDTVSAIFGSACSAVVAQAVRENRNGGRRTFLGGFDPSVRPWFDAGLLTYVIPMSRFKEMYLTMPDSCLFDTHAWGKVKQRINT